MRSWPQAGDPLHLLIDRVERRVAQRARRRAVGCHARLAVHPHEPLGRRQEDHRVVAPPAVRVGVLVRLVVPQPSALGERLDHRGVGFEHLLAGKQPHLVGEAAVRADGRVDLEAVFHARQVVVRAMAGRGVHGAGALLERDVVGQHGQRRPVVQRVRELQPVEFGAGDRRNRPRRTPSSPPRTPSRPGPSAMNTTRPSCWYAPYTNSG